MLPRSARQRSVSSGSPHDRLAPPETVWVLTIGDELLAGDVTDTNLAFLARCCREAGATVLRAISVRDRVEEIVEVLVDAAARGVGACLVSGGLGPTTDDRTTAAVAEAGGVQVRRDPEAVTRLREKFRAFGIDDMPPANLKQADFPIGAEILANPVGTAEGHMLQIGSCRVFSMPGVPRELMRMAQQEVLPRLVRAWSLSEVPRRIYRVLGHGESSIARRIEGVLQQAQAGSPGLANMFVHYRASMPEVSVILEGVAGPGGAAATAEELASVDTPMAEALGSGLYGIGEAGLAARVLAALGRAGLSMAVAESCTGGGVAALLTAVPGASAAFVGGIIAYDNSVKVRCLSVPEAALSTHGAVSEPVARAMAHGGRAALGADLCVAVTGVAGPDGGSSGKPVGDVHLAVCDGVTELYKLVHLRGDRGTVQRSAARCALKLVWDHLVSQGQASVAAMD